MSTHGTVVLVNDIWKAESIGPVHKVQSPSWFDSLWGQPDKVSCVDDQARSFVAETGKVRRRFSTESRLTTWNRSKLQDCKREEEARIIKNQKRPSKLGRKVQVHGASESSSSNSETTHSSSTRLAEIKFHPHFIRRNKSLVEELNKPAPNAKDLWFTTHFSQSFTHVSSCLWKQRTTYWRNSKF